LPDEPLVDAYPQDDEQQESGLPRDVWEQGSPDATDVPDVDDVDPATPPIEVVPEYLDFGFVPCGHAVHRTMRISNNGGADFHASLVVIDDPDAVYSVGQTELSVAAQSFTSVIVQASLAVGVQPPKAASLMIESDDPATSALKIPLYLIKAEGICRASFVPALLSPSEPVVPPLKGQFRLVNTGNGNCNFTRAVVVDCPPGADSVCPDPFESTASPFFAVSPVPDGDPVVVAPGTEMSFELQFDPPPDGGITEFRALLAVELTDENGCPVTPKTIVLPVTREPNIHLRVAADQD
jgi:hypothetical protein